MVQKKLQKGSEYEHLDVDGDGIVTDEELEMDRTLVVDCSEETQIERLMHRDKITYLVG